MSIFEDFAAIDWYKEAQHFRSERDELRALVGEMATFIDWRGHSLGCDFTPACTCGFDALLARAQEATRA